MVEMSLAHGVISNTVPVAVEPHPARIQGRHGYSRVEHRLVLQGNLRHVTRRLLAAPPLDLAPLFWGAPKVSGLPGLPETPASKFLNALVVLSLPDRHQTALQGVPQRHEAPEHV